MTSVYSIADRILILVLREDDLVANPLLRARIFNDLHGSSMNELQIRRHPQAFTQREIDGQYRSSRVAHHTHRRLWDPVFAYLDTSEGQALRAIMRGQVHHWLEINAEDDESGQDIDTSNGLEMVHFRDTQWAGDQAYWEPTEHSMIAHDSPFYEVGGKVHRVVVGTESVSMEGQSDRRWESRDLMICAPGDCGYCSGAASENSDSTTYTNLLPFVHRIDLTNVPDNGHYKYASVNQGIRDSGILESSPSPLVFQPTAGSHSGPIPHNTLRKVIFSDYVEREAAVCRPPCAICDYGSSYNQ